ncbi:MAG TPA: ABC transporter substrate-binding protein [Roseiflexaceae bacterium]|nr:ABC transporter substrate-binding protein [Roseiflexaceae bacterium]HMP41011.1 ABC transporter substrate-binding protein [Roseiflexaceae bacterium]
MSGNRLIGGLIAMLMLITLLAACGQSTPATPAEPAAPAATTAPAEPAAPAAAPAAVTLQLKWVAQAQFAGYYAALEQGYYTAEGLNVTIRPGGPDIVPEQVVASGQAQFGINWLASLLATREQGVPLVNIAQIYTYAGMRQLSWKDTNITTPADLRGKNVAVWFGGNEYNLLATLAKYNLDKDNDLTLVQQPFDMNLLLNREVDSAAAMTYNELYQVLSAGHTIDELNIIDYNAEETAMPEDGIFVSADWLNADAANKDIAARFLRASIKGWEYCRDNVDACVDYVLKQDTGGVMTRDAQTWQMQEVNKLIWGDPVNTATRVGYMEPELFTRGAATALQFGVITQPADEAAYTHEIWNMATGN